MTQWPSITTGLGKLTPDLWHRLIKMLKWYESQQLDYRRAASVFSGTSSSVTYFLATITDSTEITADQNIYRYSWTEVKLLEDDDGVNAKFEGRTGLKTSATTGALNLCELQNDDENVSPGVDIDATEYPANFTMRAIGSCIDDVQLDTVVIMYEIIDDTGETRWVFSLANAHDGTCFA